jgi:hypothetical protein
VSVALGGAVGAAVAVCEFPLLKMPVPDRDSGLGEPQVDWVTSPGWCTIRLAGSIPAYSGRIARTRSFKIVIERVQRIRSASTVAGIRGNSLSHLRISGSTASTSEPFAGLE